MADETSAEVVDALFGALARGDVEAALACLTPEARIWHSFDQVAQDHEAAGAGWKEFIAAFSFRAFVDVRRQAFPGGLVQQHLLVATAGERSMAWPACIVVRIEDGRIARLDEYMDRAGHFAPADGATTTTPGMAAAEHFEGQTA